MHRLQAQIAIVEHQSIKHRPQAFKTEPNQRHKSSLPALGDSPVTKVRQSNFNRITYRGSAITQASTTYIIINHREIIHKLSPTSIQFIAKSKARPFNGIW
jgi:hypothetical protein